MEVSKSAGLSEAHKLAIMEAMSDAPSNGDPRDYTVLKFKRITKDAFSPRYATDGAACFDLFAMEATEVKASYSETIRTGIAVEIPPTHVLLVFSRSGHGFNNSIRLANCVGVIDSDYRGEIMVKLTSDTVEDAQPFHIARGHRVAQAMLVPIPRAVLVECDELSETIRGAGGFGSTGH